VVELTEAQIADLHQLQQFCAEFKAEIVIIGAIAYQYHFPREDRHTSDIDSAVALDLDDFAELEKRLEAAQWSRTPNREHRWRSARGTLLDLIPAGTELRKAKQVTWPESQFTMSLVGFDHVFSDAESAELAPHLTVKIIPPVVLLLLKIVAFLDDQNRRAKDLLDIRSMLLSYEEDSERIFSDAVLDAKLADFSLANAFLLGMDLRSLCNLDELLVVREFVKTVEDESKPAWMAFVRSAPNVGERNEEQARLQLEAFKKGLNQGSRPAKKIESAGTSKEPPQGSTSSILDRLRTAASQHARVRVRPQIPLTEFDEFNVAEIDPEKDTVVLRNSSSSRRANLPISRVAGLFHAGPGQADVLEIDGRLQWLTVTETWEYFSEKPNSDWGVAKRSNDNNPGIAAVSARARSKGYDVGWANENTVAALHGSVREIFYDSDGRYFRKADRPYDQILVRVPKLT
jgi:predicted nucleotidyltransferase